MKHTNLLTKEDLAMFDRIDNDCLAMHLPFPPKTFIELSVSDKNGKEIERYSDRAHSWNRNAHNIELWMLSALPINTSTWGAGTLSIKQISGAVVGGAYNSPYDAPNSWIGGAGAITHGIIIGTGTTAESFDHYALSARIASGGAAGQMAYGAQSAHAVTYNATTKKWSVAMQRIFNNNSGAGISVAETGIYSLYSGGYSMMVCRDLLASPVTVPNAGQLTVTYTIEMTFPA